MLGNVFKSAFSFILVRGLFNMDKDIGNVKYFNKEDLRFATPLVIANYRAKRLKCNKIVDLCSGIGIQSGAFAKTCKEVYAFEIDSRKVEYAKKNFKNINNIRFICGDVLSREVIDKIKEIKPDIIFCDPERIAEEKERNLDSIKPDIKKLVKVYSKITPNICIEMPPRIDIKKLNELGEFGGFEAEYLSIDKKLNRLNLYFGKLKEFEIRAVDVGSGLFIFKNDSVKQIKKTKNIGDYIYEISDSVIKAGLINEIGKWIDDSSLLEGTEKNKVILTTNDLSLEFSHALYEAYFVIGVVNNLNEINRILIKDGFGKAVIKYSIDPKDYWKERNLLEKGLIGEKEAVIFKINGRYMIGEEV